MDYKMILLLISTVHLLTLTRYKNITSAKRLCGCHGNAYIIHITLHVNLQAQNIETYFTVLYKFAMEFVKHDQIVVY